MTVLDAYAVVAYLAGGPAAPRVRELLRAGDAVVATANLAEALDVTERLYGLPVARAFEHLEPLLDGTITPVVLDVDTARRAAMLRARHYDRNRCRISMADAILLASAGAAGRIATADPDVLAVAEAEGTGTTPLPGQG
ncbi:MAG: PIN domain-containing protein [Trueperaceae bacterium]|nr:PIN domain-containing protein [Trueperaceae bacterium]